MTTADDVLDFVCQRLALRENPTSSQISISYLIASVEQQSFVHDDEP